ncbi:hypothetical protein D3C73_947600 [compost metagenome]
MAKEGIPCCSVFIPHNGLANACKMLFTDILGGIERPLLISLYLNPKAGTSTSTTKTGHSTAFKRDKISSLSLFSVGW